MKYIFYADSFFLLNMGLDYLLLRITGCLWKKQITPHYLLGAFLGAALTLAAMFIKETSAPMRAAVYLVISVVMCRVAFCEKRWKSFLKMWCSLYACAFFLGGMIQMMYQTMDRNTVTFLMRFVFSYLCLEYLVYRIRVRMGKTAEGDLFTVEIRHGSHSCRILALYDTGNSVTEPISRKPVHIIDEETGKIILGERRETQDIIRAVPYHSLGNESGMMFAFPCEEMEILAGEEKIILKNEFLGIYRGKLTGKRYHMILNRSINKWL